MQSTDFELFVGHFRPTGENDQQKKQSTMLPQATGTFA
jgi:hypothetical protein